MNPSETVADKTEIQETENKGVGDDDSLNLVAVGLVPQENKTVKVQLLVIADQKEPSETQLVEQLDVKDDDGSEHSVDFEELIREDEEDKFLNISVEKHVASELTTPEMSSPCEMKDCDKAEIDVAAENPLYSNDKLLPDFSTSFIDSFDQPRTNEEMKDVVKQLLEEYEEDCVQQKKLFEQMNSLLKTLRTKKEHLLRTLVEVSEDLDPALKSLPKSGRLVQQEQLLKKLFLAKSVLDKLETKTEQKEPLSKISLQVEKEDKERGSVVHCSFSKLPPPAWMTNKTGDLSKPILRNSTSLTTSSDFEDSVLQVNLEEKTNRGSYNATWVSKETVLLNMETKRKQQERQKLLQKKQNEEEAKRQQKLKPTSKPKSLSASTPAPPAAIAASSSSPTLPTSTAPRLTPLVASENQPVKKESETGDLLSGLLGMGLGSESKSEVANPSPSIRESPREQSTQFIVSQPPQSLLPKSTGVQSLDEVQSTAPIVPVPAQVSMTREEIVPVQTNTLFRNMGAFSKSKTGSQLGGTAPFGQSAFSQSSFPSLGLSSIAPSLGSLAKPQQGAAMDQGGFAGITGGFAGVTGGFGQLVQKSQSMQTGQSSQFGSSGFGQFAQQSSSFQSSFFQASQSGASSTGTGTSVFGSQPSPQNKALWQMRK